jgi:predicted transcriptional regulator
MTRRLPERLEAKGERVVRAHLAEQLYQAVKAWPGETMRVLAARVGGKPRAVHRSMLHLKATGRVRSAGERNFTRYFPMVA